MDIFLTNNLTNKKEQFIPKDKQNVGMYVCGPTVYDDPHIGNARPLVVFDILFRLLKNTFLKVTYVRNITDIDDKIINGRAFPICGSSYTVGPQTYIPICFLSFGTNCSFLFVKLFVKKISILID